MNKTISINIGGQNFLIEEGAHEKLQDYLEEIKQHFGVNADTEEVIADIESGIAEKLKATLSPYKDVITSKEINALIKVMGTIEDFDREIGENKTEGKNRNSNIKRRLYRDNDNAIIGGVASGLGAYFDIDPVIFRVIFFILIFASGVGILAYIILWIAMPEAKTANQKLEMRGQAPTISAFKKLSINYKNSWKNRWKSFPALSKILSFPLLLLNCLIEFIKKFGSIIWKIVKFLLGLFLLLFSLLGLFLIGLGCVYLLLQMNAPYRISFIPISELVQTIPFIWLVISGFFSLAIPTILLLFGGLAIIRKKSSLTFSIGTILIAIWMLAGISCCALGLRYFPDLKNKFDNYPELKKIDKNIEISNVTKLITSGENISIEIIPESKNIPTAILKGRKIDINNLTIKKENDTISFSEMENKEQLCIGCEKFPVKLIISSNLITEVTAENGSNVSIQKGVTNIKNLTANNDAQINFESDVNSNIVATSKNKSTINILEESLNKEETLNNINKKTATLNLEESSTIFLNGKFETIDVISKATNRANVLNASNVQVKNITLNTSGKTIFIIGKTEEITAAATNNGNGTIFYTGKPIFSENIKNYKFVNYEEMNETEFERLTESDSEETEKKNKENTSYIHAGNKYFILHQGDLSEETFEKLIDFFETEQDKINED